MFSVLVIRLRSLRLLRVSGIVMRLRMFLLLITFLKAHNRSEERFSRNAETELVCRCLLEKNKGTSIAHGRTSAGNISTGSIEFMAHCIGKVRYDHILLLESRPPPMYTLFPYTTLFRSV